MNFGQVCKRWNIVEILHVFKIKDRSEGHFDDYKRTQQFEKEISTVIKYNVLNEKNLPIRSYCVN